METFVAAVLISLLGLASLACIVPQILEHVHLALRQTLTVLGAIIVTWREWKRQYYPEEVAVAPSAAERVARVDVAPAEAAQAHIAPAEVVKRAQVRARSA